MRIKDVRTSAQKKNRKPLPLILVIVLLCMLLLTIGVAAAFFSDLIFQKRTINTGTLKLSGDYSFSLNGTAISAGDLENLGPGDVVVVTGNVSNMGSKSAWVREQITVSDALLPFFEVYAGEFTQAEILSGSDLSAHLVPFNAAGIAVGANKVIDGTGANAETESGAGFTYLEAAAYNFAYTVYFKTSATNEAQAKSFDFTVAIQALQFRNNNAAEPDETAWATVMAAA